MGLNMKEKQAVTREYKPRYQKAAKKERRPANRAGKRIYTDEAVASLRLIWTFFWYKCGSLPDGRPSPSPPKPPKNSQPYAPRQTVFARSAAVC
jgi:hypothetical protein